MILNSFFNVYYSFLFLLVGAAYTYRILRKNQIQMSLDNNFVVTSSSQR